MIWRAFWLCPMSMVWFGNPSSSTSCLHSTLPKRDDIKWVCDREDTGGNNVLGGTCRASCEKDKALEANIVTTCTPMGWVPARRPNQIPPCHTVTCPNLLNYRTSDGQWKCRGDTNMESKTQKPGSVCSLYCDTGFNATMGSTSVCTETGWVPDPDTLVCLNLCTTPKNPPNGKWRCEVAHIAKTTFCVLECNLHYQPQGKRIVRCENEKYIPSPQESQCVPVNDRAIDHVLERAAEGKGDNKDVFCDPLPPPEFGWFDCDSAGCRLVCETGYKLSRPVIAKCKKDGIWCSPDIGLGCLAEGRTPITESEKNDKFS